MAETSILFCSQFFPGATERFQTGGTISNKNFLRALAKNYEVTVLSFDRSPTSSFDSEPFEVIRRPAPNWRSAQLLKNWLPFVRRETQRVIDKRPPPRAIIATTSSLTAFDVAPPTAKTIAIVQAYENFGLRCPWVPPRQRLALAKNALVRRFQDVRLLRTADSVLTNSQFMKDAIAERFAIEDEDIYVIPQYCDIKDLQSAPPQRTIGFVHRGPDKNIAFVLELARLSPDLQYVVFGHCAALPSKMPANVSVRGWSTNRDLMFTSAALWIIPSIWAEPFGRVSIEAQAAGRVVLVADRGGLPETIFDPRYCIAGFRPEEWLSRMRLLLEHNEGMLAENQARVRANFSLENHDARIFDAMSSILK